MARLSLKQILIAIALGALFATLQGEPPIHAHAKTAAASCVQSQNRC